MANWGEMNMQRIQQLLESLRSARQGSVSRGAQMQQSLGGVGQAITGGFGKLSDILGARGAEKRGFAQEEKMQGIEHQGRIGEIDRTGDLQRELEELRQGGNLAKSTADEESFMKRYGPDSDYLKWLREEAAMGGGGEAGREDKMQTAYEAAWNAVTTNHPEMWETGQFVWKPEGVKEDEFLKQVRRFRLDAEDEALIMDAFRSMLNQGGEEEIPDIDEISATEPLTRQQASTMSARELVDAGYASNLGNGIIIKVFLKDLLAGNRELPSQEEVNRLTPRELVDAGYADNIITAFLIKNFLRGWLPGGGEQPVPVSATSPLPDMPTASPLRRGGPSLQEQMESIKKLGR